jgi:hypothetical protein
VLLQENNRESNKESIRFGSRHPTLCRTDITAMEEYMMGFDFNLFLQFMMNERIKNQKVQTKKKPD